MPLLLHKFGEFELDCARFELRRDGRPLKLERIPMELLILLAEWNGNVVPRQEISERLWGKEVFVDTDHGINTAIRKIRAVLREDAERPRYVHTVPGKGYRFVAAPEPSNGNAATLIVNSPAPSQTVAVVPSAAEPLQSQRMKWRTAMLAAVALCLLAGAVLALNVAGLRDHVFTRSQIGPIHSIAVLPLANLSGGPSQDTSPMA